jgi:hypothetical protein
VLLRLVADDLRASIRRPQVIAVAALLCMIPPVTGFLSLSQYALDHWTSYFTIMLDWVALFFPLVVALLTQIRLVDEWSNTYAFLTRTRVAPGVYFTARALVSAIMASAVFCAMTAISFVVAKVTFTSHGIDVPLIAPIETRYPFSQLWEISPAVWIATYCLWVAVVAGSVGAWCTMLTALLANKFVAVVAPLVLWIGATFALEAGGLDYLGLPPFRFSITQQPIWTEFPGWVAIVLVTVVLHVVVARRDYQTPGIAHT